MAPIPGSTLRRRFLAADLLDPTARIRRDRGGRSRGRAARPWRGAGGGRRGAARVGSGVAGRPARSACRRHQLGCTPIWRRSSPLRSSRARPWRRCATRQDRSIARTGTGPGAATPTGFIGARGLDCRVREHGSAAGRRRLRRRVSSPARGGHRSAGRPRHHARGRNARRVPVLAAARGDAGRMGHSGDHRHLVADAGRDEGARRRQRIGLESPVNEGGGRHVTGSYSVTDHADHYCFAVGCVTAALVAGTIAGTNAVELA